MATRPVQNGYITSGYGFRILNGVQENHRGIDIGTKTIDENVLCTKGGLIAHIDKTPVYNKETGAGSFGNVVYIQMQDGWYAIYPHLKSIHSDLRIGSKINEGDVIGIIGNTGFSFGVHLHYEERDNMSRKSKSREPIDIIELYK